MRTLGVAAPATRLLPSLGRVGARVRGGTSTLLLSLSVESGLRPLNEEIKLRSDFRAEYQRPGAIRLAGSGIAALAEAERPSHQAHAAWDLARIMNKNTIYTENF
jgi:hypothetical protein